MCNIAAPASPRPGLYKSGHTQTCQNTQILYYHESKQAALEEALPLLADEDDQDPDQEHHLAPGEERITHSQYKWKRCIPASKFGVIINAKGNLKDQEVETKVFPFFGKFNF